MQSTRPPQDETKQASPLSEGSLRRLNLFFIFNIASAPLSTSRIISDCDLGYGKGDPKSERKKFERDRQALAERGIHIVEVQKEGASATEERSWTLDRTLSKSPLTGLSLDELDHLFAETSKMATNPFWRGNRGLIDLQGALKVELATRYKAHLPSAVSSIDEAPANPLATFLWESLSLRRTISFSYKNHQGETRVHEVEVYALFQQEDLLYFVGRDTEANIVKTFRCDRATDVRRMSSPTYQIPADFSLTEHLFLPFDISPSAPVEARFSFPRAISPYEMESLSHGRGEVALCEEKGWWELRIEVRDIDAAASWALSHASLGMRPLAPEELCSAWRAQIQKAVDAHER